MRPLCGYACGVTVVTVPKDADGTRREDTRLHWRWLKLTAAKPLGALGVPQGSNHGSGRGQRQSCAPAFGRNGISLRTRAYADARSTEHLRACRS